MMRGYVYKRLVWKTSFTRKRIIISEDITIDSLRW